MRALAMASLGMGAACWWLARAGAAREGGSAGDGDGSEQRGREREQQRRHRLEQRQRKHGSGSSSGSSSGGSSAVGRAAGARAGGSSGRRGSAQGESSSGSSTGSGTAPAASSGLQHRLELWPPAAGRAAEAPPRSRPSAAAGSSPPTTRGTRASTTRPRTRCTPVGDLHREHEPDHAPSSGLGRLVDRPLRHPVADGPRDAGRRADDVRLRGRERSGAVPVPGERPRRGRRQLGRRHARPRHPAGQLRALRDVELDLRGAGVERRLGGEVRSLVEYAAARRLDLRRRRRLARPAGAREGLGGQRRRHQPRDALHRPEERSRATSTRRRTPRATRTPRSRRWVCACASRRASTRSGFTGPDARHPDGDEGVRPHPRGQREQLVRERRQRRRLDEPDGPACVATSTR